MTAPVIRRLTPLDTTAITDVATHLSREWGLSLGYSFEETVKWCFEVARATDQCILVATEKDAIVGMVLVVDNDLETETSLTPWLSALYVVPSARRRGIGRFLTAAAANFARQTNATALYLYAASGPLVTYYGKLGLQELSRFVRQGVDYVIMQHPLSD
jgi:predicted N-acetyltransferase YhbS